MREAVLKLGIHKGMNPMIASAATMAAGFIRSIAIKRYNPKSRQREIRLLNNRPEAHATRCLIYREKGIGSYPTIVLGGFVPDSTESVEFQRSILRHHGSIYFLNYPRNGFCCDMLAAQLEDLIFDLRKKGQRPLLMGISFGCGLLTSFLRKASEAVHEQIRGLVLISPVICTDDLIRPAGEKRDGIRFLESNLKKIVSTDPAKEEDLEKQIERSRRCFHALFTAGAENRQLSVQHLAIRNKIMDVINKTPSRGGFERVVALRDFSFPRLGSSVFAGPVLTLMAENELDIMVPSSPTLKMFRDPDMYNRLFPKCTVKTVRSKDPADGVAHASLIFHHEAYNTLIDNWYHKLLYPRLQLAV
jgi:pimeloyl-ACP methyl ester carboxylesterase